LGHFESEQRSTFNAQRSTLNVQIAPGVLECADMSALSKR
jgi:hypothetical protein